MKIKLLLGEFIVPKDLRGNNIFYEREKRIKEDEKGGQKEEEKTCEIKEKKSHIFGD